MQGIAEALHCSHCSNAETRLTIVVQLNKRPRYV